MVKQQTVLKKLIRRYLNKRASGAEKYILNRWYKSFRYDKDDIPSSADDEERLILLQQRIIGHVSATKLTPSRYKYKRVQWFAAAAVLCLLSVSLILYLRNRPWQSQEESRLTAQFSITGVRQVKHLILPDSTEIFLNANSKLEVDPDFGKEQRIVKLSGEAYFDVKRNPLRPFRVFADGIEVKVLGTTFNISAYPQLKDIKVSINTGKVQVSNQIQIMAILEANEQLAYTKQTSAYRKFTVKSGSQSSWKGGIAILDRVGFDELAQVIYNSYGMQIKSQDKQVVSTVYNFTVRSSRTLEQTMDQLCGMITKKYRKEGDQIIIY